MGPLPRRLLQWTLGDGELLPAWLLARDRPWLRDLLATTSAGEGAPLHDLVRRWRLEAADPRAGPRAAMARHCLLALLRAHAPRPQLPARLRREAFTAVAAGMSRAQAIEHCAKATGVAAAAVETQLFADLPLQRPLHWPAGLHAAHFALVVNQALAQGLLATADSARLELRGAARATLRTAWLHGADLQVAAIGGNDVQLRWHARAGRDGARSRRGLATLLPVLGWAREFELRVHCSIDGRAATLVLDHRDPLLPGPEPRAYDSALEQRFAAAFLAAAPQWSLLREPQPCLVGSELVFPDFELRHRDGHRLLLEIAGLRQPAALAGKLAALHALPLLVLCLPRAAVPPALAQHPRIVPFARRVEVGAVLRCVEALRG